MPSRKDRLKPLAARSSFHINALLVQPGRLVIIRDGVETRLELRMMEVLVMLADRADALVSKEELLEKVWGSIQHNDNVVEKTISQLRTAIGEDVRAPRFIETAGNGCYRLIAKVVHHEDRRTTAPISAWQGRNPYVGLSAFDAGHTDVFCGRKRMVSELLGAMRKQIDNQRRFVFIAGSSGCGKTSLLRAGVLPLLQREGGFEGMRALSVATCDLAAAQGGDVIELLASALATWSFGGRSVFAHADLAKNLIQQTGSMAGTITEVFLRHPDRQLSGQPHAHLLLVIDHAEVLVASKNVAHEEQADVSRIINALCECPRILVVMIARNDFPKLLEKMPELADRKAGDGHVDVWAPRVGEIGEIIREPAKIAGLRFDIDPESSSRLDEVLRDTALEQNDVLPLLQHTLQALYELRTEDGLLTFKAYNEIGGLEGALTKRAEEIFAELPDFAKARLDSVLSQLIVVQPGNESISSKHVLNTALLDEGSRILIKAFIDARLFIGELKEGQPSFGVAHDALLRQWKRAKDWVKENLRLLEARAHLQQAANRWANEGRKTDNLLNPGRPLAEALEVKASMSAQLSKDEHSFLEASERQSLRRRNIRSATITILCGLTLISTTSAIIALRARSDERDRSAEAQRLANYMLVTLADELNRQGNLKLLDGIGSETLANLTRRSTDNLEQGELIILAKAYRTTGQVSISKARFVGAETALKSALETIDIAIKRNPASTQAINEKAQIVYYFGKIKYDSSDYVGAERYWQQYLRLSDDLECIEPDNVEWLVEKSYALTNLGVLAYDRGDTAVAISFYKRALVKQKQAISIKIDDPDLQKDYLDTLSRITSAEESIGLLDVADQGHENQIDELRDLIRTSPDAVAWKRYLANSLIRRANLLLNRGRASDANPMVQESIDLLSAAVKKEPANLNWIRDLARAHMEASDSANALGDMAARNQHLSTAIEISNSLLKSDDPTDEWRRLNALLILRKGLSNDSFNEAEAELNKAIEILSALSTKYPRENSGLISISSALVARGNLYARNSDQQKARKDWAAAAKILSMRQSNNPEFVYILVSAQSSLGNEENFKKDSEWLKEIGFHSHSLNYY